MQVWFRQLVRETTHGLLLLTGTLVVIGLFVGTLSVLSGVGLWLMGAPLGRAAAAVAADALVVLPGVLGLAVIGVFALARWFPGPKSRALQGTAEILGLGIAQVPGYFVASGSHAGREVRLECQSMGGLVHQVSFQVSCEARGYGAFIGRRRGEPLLQGLDQPWLKSIQADPLVSEAFELLMDSAPAARMIAMTPDCLYARGTAGWVEDEATLHSRTQAVLDLAGAIERCPPPTVSEGTLTLKLMRAGLRFSESITPLLQLMRPMNAVMIGLGTVSSVTWIVGAWLLVLIATA